MSLHWSRAESELPATGSIVANTRSDVEADLREATRLVGALTRELNIVVELPGPTTVRLTTKREELRRPGGLGQAERSALMPGDGPPGSP